MEIIELVSDDEQPAEKSRKSKSPKSGSNNCINFKCNSGSNMKLAPSFACVFYGSAPTKKKMRYICEACFDAAIRHQEVLKTRNFWLQNERETVQSKAALAFQDLVDCLVNRKPLLACDFPDHTMEVEISDSDDSDNEDSKGFKEEGMTLNYSDSWSKTISILFRSTLCFRHLHTRRRSPGH